MLTERQTHILELIVSEYVERAVPVASQALGRHHQVGVSAATLGCEMAEREAQWYLNQPTTSPCLRGFPPLCAVCRQL